MTIVIEVAVGLALIMDGGEDTQIIKKTWANRYVVKSF